MQLADIGRLLSEQRDEACVGGRTENVTITTHADAVVVEGNRPGLIELSRLILMVASKDIDGAHQDIDTSHFASSADRILTIALNTKLS